MLTDMQFSNIRNLLNNKELFLPLAEDPIIRAELEAAYEQLAKECSSYVKTLSQEAISRMGYAKALSQHKIDPYLAGGAAQGAAGLGAGVLAGAGAANRNAQIDASRKEYAEKVSQDSRNSYSVEERLILSMCRVEHFLNRVPRIKAYREKEKSNAYQACVDELRQYQYKKVSWFRLFNSCTNIMLNPNFEKIYNLNKKFNEFGEYEDSKNYAVQTAELCRKIRKHTLGKSWTIAGVIIALCFIIPASYIIHGARHSHPIAVPTAAVTEADPALKYEQAMNAMNAGSYTEAAIKFELLNGFQDSAQYAAYCKGMQITQMPCSLRKTKEAFEAAGGIGESAEYLALLEEYRESCPGIYRHYRFNNLSDYLIIDENLKASYEYDPIELSQLTYSYELYGKVNDHYKIFSALELHLGSAKLFDIEFDDSFTCVTEKRDSGEDYFNRIDADVYATDVKMKNAAEEMDAIVSELGSFPYVSTEEMMKILLNTTVDISNGYTARKFTFHDNNTYTVENSEDIQEYPWKLENGNLYAYRNGKPIYLYYLQKYFDGQYLLCQQDTDNTYMHVFIMTVPGQAGIPDETPLLKEEYFYECKDIPTPDAISDLFLYRETRDRNGRISHLYTVNTEPEEEANSVLNRYYDYLCLNRELRSLDYTFTRNKQSGAFLILKKDQDEPLVEIAGGTDPELGYFIICTMNS